MLFSCAAPSERSLTKDFNTPSQGSADLTAARTLQTRSVHCPEASGSGAGSLPGSVVAASAASRTQSCSSLAGCHPKEDMKEKTVKCTYCIGSAGDLGKISLLGFEQRQALTREFIEQGGIRTQQVAERLCLQTW